MTYIAQGYGNCYKIPNMLYLQSSVSSAHTVQFKLHSLQRYSVTEHFYRIDPLEKKRAQKRYRYKQNLENKRAQMRYRYKQNLENKRAQKRMLYSKNPQRERDRQKRLVGLFCKNAL